MIRRVLAASSCRTAVVVVAVLVACGGSATAASVITSKQIKDGTIQVRDLSKSARDSLKGRKGPAGAMGIAGPTGPTGPPGLSGSAGSSGAQGLQGAKGDAGSTADLSGYVRGYTGRAVAAQDSDPNTSEAAILAVPGFGRVESTYCNGSGVLKWEVRFVSNASSNLEYFGHVSPGDSMDYGAAIPSGGSVAADASSTVGRASFVFRRADGQQAEIDVRVSAVGSGACTLLAQASVV
jgi:hypothetical protein